MMHLPREWRHLPLKEVCLPVVKMDPVGTGRHEIRYVDIGSVDGSRQRLTEVVTVAVSEAPTRARQIIQPGDTLFSTVRPYLRKIAYVDDSLAGEFASTGFAVLRPSEEILPRYLFYFAISETFLNQVLPQQRGSAIRPCETVTSFLRPFLCHHWSSSGASSKSSKTISPASTPPKSTS